MSMRLISLRRLGMAAAVLLPAAAVALPSAHAATDVQTLVAQAEHDTNTVQTLIHHDTRTLTSPNGSLKFIGMGSEDEVRNREKDYESVVVQGRNAAGKMQTLRYTADIVFINGTTYYRLSFQKNVWKSMKGTVFQDPYTGGWKRGRTTVTFAKGTTFSLIDTNNGQTHVQAPYTDTKNQVTGTVELWISSGSTPYVVKELFKYHAMKNAKAAGTSEIDFGPFNTQLTILAPTVGGSA